MEVGGQGRGQGRTRQPLRNERQQQGEQKGSRNVETRMGRTGDSAGLAQPTLLME